MKKHNTRSFLAGVVVTLLVVALAVPALAAMAGKTIEVFTGVNVYVNDQKIEPKDVNGNPVEVFVYNGTTYLPIRAIGNALGMPVDWDGKTQSAFVGKHQSEKPVVWLKDLDYFVGSNPIVKESEKDNLGNTHQAITGSFETTYLINGQYSAISGTFFQTYINRSRTENSTIYIYGDGNLLYTAEVTGGVKPIDFYVDLTGVLELKVKLSSYYKNSSTGYNAAIGECGLWS